MSKTLTPSNNHSRPLTSHHRVDDEVNDSALRMESITVVLRQSSTTGWRAGGDEVSLGGKKMERWKDGEGRHYLPTFLDLYHLFSSLRTQLMLPMKTDILVIGAPVQ